MYPVTNDVGFPVIEPGRCAREMESSDCQTHVSLSKPPGQPVMSYVCGLCGPTMSVFTPL